MALRRSSHWGVCVRRGFAHRKLGQFDEAISDYTESLRLQPNNVKTLNNRGYSYAKKGLYMEAIQDYNTVLSIDPDNAHAFHNRGVSQR